MECSLYGSVGEASLGSLIDRLRSISSASCDSLCEEAVYQTSTGTRSSSMARVRTQAGSVRLRIESSADVTHASESTVVAVNECTVKAGQVAGFLEAMGYRLSHSYRVRESRFSQFCTALPLEIVAFQVLTDSMDNEVAGDWIVKCCLRVETPAETAAAEETVHQFAAHLAE